MSPRAAVRLEQLGFERVYDYAPGKDDWSGAGLPREGRSAAVPNSGDLARAVPTCAPGDPIDAARSAMDGMQEPRCVVVDDDRTVLGDIEASAVPPDASGCVRDFMSPGPTTVRANETLDSLQALVERMESAGIGSILVTDADGRLLGSMRRDDARRALATLERLAHEHQHA